MAEQEPDARTAGPEGGLRGRTLAGMIWTFSGAGFQAILRLVLILVLARLLGPEAFGVVGAALVVIHLALVFSNLGISAALVQRPALGPRHVQTAFGFALASGALVSLALQLLTPAIVAFFEFEGLTGVLRMLALVPLLHNLGIVAEGLARRALAFRRLAVISVISFALGYGLVGVGLALSGAGVWALVGANLAEAGARSVMLLATQPHAKTGVFDRVALRDLVAFSGGLTIKHLGQALAQSLDNIVVGRWLGAEALGVYGRAYQLISMPPAVLGNAIIAVLFPVMSRVQHDRARLAAAYRRGTAVLGLLTFPTVAAVLVLAPELVLALLGPAWVGVIVPLQILAPGVFLRMVFQVSDSLATATGAVYAIAWRQGVFAAAVLTGALIGQRWGLPGVAAGVLGAQILYFFLSTQLSLALTSLAAPVFAAALRRGVLLGTLVGGELLLLVVTLRHLEAPPGIILGMAALLVSISVVALIRLRLIGPDGLWLLEGLAGRLPPRFAALPRLLGLSRPAAAEMSS
jgi:O-antigen/teichoic acid export membrane protein